MDSCTPATAARRGWRVCHGVARSRIAAEPPAGLVYRAGFLSAEEERAVLREIERLAFGEIRMHGVVARRTARHYGLDYDYERRTPVPGEPLPGWLEDVRAAA